MRATVIFKEGTSWKSRLQPEKEAPADSDCIKISSLSDGRFRLVTSALFEGDSDADESVAVVGGATYATYDAAEAAGITWADEQGLDQLYVKMSQLPIRRDHVIHVTLISLWPRNSSGDHSP